MRSEFEATHRRCKADATGFDPEAVDNHTGDGGLTKSYLIDTYAGI